MQPRISVIIPFFNAENTLAECIEGVLAQNMLPHEIILVNNNSVDDSGEIAKEYAKNNPQLCKYVVEEKQGAAAARNKGVNEANTEIVSFIDSDCLPEPDWLQKIVEPFADSRIGAVAGRIVGMGGDSLFDKFHTLFTLKSLPKAQLFKEFSLIKGGFPTANLSIRKDVFKKISGFDESMNVSGEDYDLCARIYRAGFWIQYRPESIVHHKHRNNLKGTWRQSFEFGLGHPALLKKHFNRLVILELPRWQYCSRDWPARMWLNFASADKKMIALLLVILVWPPFAILPVCYLFFLFSDMGVRLEQNKMSASRQERFLMVFLLLLKSLAFSCGRIVGSLRAGIICI